MNPYVDYYARQAGGQVGDVLRSAPYQRGHGIGNFLSNIFITLFLLLEKGAKSVGKEAMSAGYGFLRDEINRKPFKKSLKGRMRKAGYNLMTQAEAKIDNMKCSGYKRKRVQFRKRVKRLKHDIFD